MKKKLLALALAVMACFTLTACSDEGKELKDMDLSKYVALGQYTNVEVSPLTVKVSEFQVEEQMRELYNAQVRNMGVTDRAVEMNDTANIDFIGYMDGVAFEGGSGQYDLKIGSGDFIEGFEDGLVGAMPGETVTLDLTFPADYHRSEYAGKDVRFDVVVNYIMPTMTDEVIESLDNENYGSVAELESFVTNMLQEEADAENKKRVINAAMYKIIMDSTFTEIPDFLLEQQKTIIQNQLSTTLEGSGFDAESYLQFMYGTSLSETAEQNVKERLVIQAIANETGIEVTDEELDTYLNGLASDYGMTVDEVYAMTGRDREYTREYLYAVEVYQYVYDNTVVVEAE